MFERLTADKVYLNSIRFGIQVNFPPHCGHEKAKEVDGFVKNVFDRLAAYEDTGLTPEQIQTLTADKDEQTKRLEEGLKKLRSSFQWLSESIRDLGYRAWAEDNIDKIDALLGGTEDVPHIKTKYII